MSKRIEADRHKVQLAGVLTQTRLRVRLTRHGAIVSAENGSAIVAAVLIVALMVVVHVGPSTITANSSGAVP